MKKGLLAVSIFVLTIYGCTTIEEQSFPANLMGIIFDNYNNPVDGATISLVESEISCTSDIDGRFLLPKLNKGRYEIIVTKDGYETNNIEIDFFDLKQVLYIKLSSLCYFKEQIEVCMKSKNWEKAERMITRAFKIDDADPVLLYLTAIYNFNVEEYGKALEYLVTLKEAGYEIEAVKALEKEIEKKKSENAKAE